MLMPENAGGCLQELHFVTKLFFSPENGEKLDPCHSCPIPQRIQSTQETVQSHRVNRRHTDGYGDRYQYIADV